MHEQNSSADARYAGIGPGWHTLIDTLEAEISNHRRNAPECPPVEVRQCKEKLGGLRYYYGGGDNHVEGLVRMAEAMSLVLCEICGCPGELVHDSWLRTRCPAHCDTPAA